MTVLRSTRPDTNVGERERWASLIGGGSLVAFGVAQRDLKGFALAAVGGGLMLRGATGHCNVYEALGVNTADRGKAPGTGKHASVPYELGIRVDNSVEINKPAAELFRFWRNFENLPTFMRHLKSVKMLDDRRSHWIAEGPAGTSVEWDAEVINEVENELIGWRSLEGSEVDNAGSVRFSPTSDGRATRVSVSLQYNPPAGSLGAAVAKLLGTDPKKQVKTDMRRFKELMEIGHITTSAANEKPRTTAPSATKEKKLWDRDKVMNSSEESFPASDPPSWTPETV